MVKEGFTMPTMSLETLVQKSGVSARTIRYYISRGVLDPPLIAGRNACYDEKHLNKLKLIKVAQDIGKSLDQIKTEHEDLTKAGWKGEIGSPFYYQDVNNASSTDFIQVIPGSERHCWTEGQVIPQIRISIRNDLLVMHKDLLSRVEEVIRNVLTEEGV
jgi:DNA-binding transcriptional MerR regulator